MEATDHPTRARGSVQYQIDPNFSPVTGLNVVIPKFATHDQPFHFSAELNVWDSGVTWNNWVADKSVYVFSHIFAHGADASRIFTSRCVINTLLLVRIVKLWNEASGTFVVPPPMTPLPLPMNAQTGMVVRPVVAVAVSCDVSVIVVADRAPPTMRLLPFHPTARAPVPIVFTTAVVAPEISANKSAEPLTSVHVRPSAEVAIVAADPLPTATHLCPGATVFVVEYAVQDIPSADHAIIFPAVPDFEEYAGPVATNRLPFQHTDVAP